jgi:hypothetical protein
MPSSPIALDFALNIELVTSRSSTLLKLKSSVNMRVEEMSVGFFKRENGFHFSNKS